MSATEAVTSARLKKRSESESPRCEQVEMEEPERPPRVEERRDEQDAERDPDPRRVDHLGDRALIAAGELGLHLEVAPGLLHLPRAPVEDHLRDLLAGSRHVAHLPASPRAYAVGLASGVSASSRGRPWSGAGARSPRDAEVSNPGGISLGEAASISSGGRSPPNGGCAAGFSSARATGAVVAARTIASEAMIGALGAVSLLISGRAYPWPAGKWCLS